MNCGTSGGTIQGNYLYEDAPFGPAPPTVEYVGSPGNGHCGGSFTHVEQADISISVPAIMNWAGTFVSADYVSGAGINVYGPVIVGAQDRFTSYNTRSSPIANGQVGTYNGVLVGAEDASRRNFPASSVRFPNLAYTNPYQWSTNGTSGYVSGGTLTTGVLAPDGTNGAATWSSSNGFIGFWFQSSDIPTPNDWYVGGVWARSTTGNGFSSGEATKFEIGALATPSTGDYCYGGNTVVYSNAYMVGDGQWFWMTFACKIWSGATSTTLAFWGGGNDSTHTVQFYAPILVRIPAGTLSDNEVWEFVRNLSTYDNGCAAGSVCNIGGQVPRNVTGYEDVKAISPPTNPATGYQRWFANSATGQFSCITSGGADCALTKLAVYNTASAASNTNISAMNMVASASAQHHYLFAWTISLTAVGNGCTGNTTVVLNEIHTDPNGGGAVTVPLQIITLANSGNGIVGFIVSGTGNILAATGTAVQYSTSSYTAGSGCTTNPSYKVQPTLVQLW